MIVRPRVPPLSLGAGGGEAEPSSEPATRVGLAALPFVLMASVAAVDLLAGPGVGFLPMLSLGPALAAVSLRPVRTIVVGALAVVLGLLLADFDHLIDTRRGIIALATIAGATAVGWAASAGRQRRERELATARAIADMAQRVLLRPVPPQVGRIEVATRYMSAVASARIGGDLYEVAATGEAVRLIIADVQGKGLPAVQTASVVLGVFREAAYDSPGLPDIAARIEASLERQAGPDEFVTAVMAEIGPQGSTVEILNCGHPAPLLLGPDGRRFVEPPEPGLPLGLASLFPERRRTFPVAFGPGDRMLFYTDGISEARDKLGNFFPLESCRALGERAGLEEALDQLRLEVVGHVGHALLDDAAILLIRYTDEPGEPLTTPGAAGPRSAPEDDREGRAAAV